MSRALRLPILLVVLAVLLGVAIRWRQRAAGRSSAAVRPSIATEAQQRGLLSPATLAQLESLEAQRRHADQTVWAPELDAQRHEAVFIHLWDTLRQSADPLTVLAEFPFETMELATSTAPETLDHDILLHRTSGAVRTLNSVELRRMIQDWGRQGWTLDGSEWRHVQFDPATNGIARSVFTMELHLAQSNPPRLAIIRGRLRVEWKASVDREMAPVVRHIDATALSIYSRAAPPLFERVLTEVILPDRDAIYVDPLMLYDLDGDGRDEIVLGGKNRLYWNKADGVFQGMRFCPKLQSRLSTAIFVDFDRDGQVDFLGVDHEGLLLFRGDVAGGFTGTPERQPMPDLLNPFVLSSGDVDGDGDLDLWLAQYKVPLRFGQMPTPYYDANDGFPSYLMLNDGHGRFRDATIESGLVSKRFRRTYSASFCDMDNDGDLDLVNVSDFAGVDLYLNDGQGRFRDVTETRLPERHLFGMAHAIVDFDNDGRPDLFAVGMNSAAAERLDHLGLGPLEHPELASMRKVMTYGNRTFLNRGDHFEPAPFARQISTSGWAWGVTAFDFDSDGDLDLYLANGHRSQRSVKEYDPQFWTQDIYVAGSETNALLELYFDTKTGQSFGAGDSYGGHQRNVFYLNAGSAGWHDVAWLFGVSLPEDSRVVASDDFDGDGRPDLLVLTEEYWPTNRQTLSIFRNRVPGTNWVSLRLTSADGYVAGEPTEVVLSTPAGNQRQWLLSGDGYRRQAAPYVHFGLGRAQSIDRLDVKQRGRILWTADRPGPGQALRMNQRKNR